MSNRRTSSRPLARASRVVTDSAREALQADVATRYYIDGFTQEEIARQIDRSVATVSRLLAQAHANQFVEVQVHSPLPVAPALQAELTRQFDLRVARVARTTSHDQHHLAPQVIELAARHLTTLLRDDAIVCLAWGTAVRGVVQAVAPGQFRGLRVVQGLGSLGSRLPTIDNPLLIQILADRVGGTPHYLSAPTIVDSPSVRDALASDPHFSETLGLFRRADVALIGIGPADPERSGLCRAGSLDPWAMERIQATGAVGDVMVEFYDLYGSLMETEVTARVMGMRREDLRAARTVVAVAGGVAKAPAILGALRTGLIHVLVTDDVTARKVLELASDYPMPLPSSGAGTMTVNPPTIPAPLRDDAARKDVLDATLRLLARDGFQRLSVDSIASAAAVDRPAIVRVWSTKAALVRDAFAELARPAAPPGSGLQCELESLLAALFIGLPDQAATMAAAHRAMLVASRHDPALHGLYRRLQQGWRQASVAVIDRARARGEISETRPSETIADLLLGPIWFRLEMGQSPIERPFLSQVVAAAIHGAAPPGAA